MSDNESNVVSLANAKSSKFSEGDVVILRSGSQLMTVNKINSDTSRKIQCAFASSDGGIQTQDYAEHLIETHEDHMARQVKIHNITCPHNPINQTSPTETA